MATKICKWKSTSDELVGFKCNCTAEENSDYCLFHKPNKNDEESKLFWTIINCKPHQDIDEKKLWEFITGGQGIYAEQKESLLKTLNEDMKPKVDEILIKYNEMLKFINVGRLLFNGFIFPAKPAFEKFNFFIHQDFKSAIDSLSFMDTEFEGMANFKDYIFEYSTTFKKVTAQQICFENAIFKENVEFDFEKIDWDETFNFRNFRNVSFECEEIIFSGQLLDLCGAKFAPYTKIIIKSDYFKEYKLRLEKDRNKQIEKIKKGNSTNKKNHIKATKDRCKQRLVEYRRLAIDNYRIAKQQTLLTGDYSLAGEYYYKERELKGKDITQWHSFLQIYKEIKYNKQKMFKEKCGMSFNLIKDFTIVVIEKIFDFFINILTGYGEKPVRIIIASLFVILGFATACANLASKSFLHSCFLSLVSFTTLGAGIENSELTSFTKTMLGVESFIGALFMALLVLTISKKYSR